MLWAGPIWASNRTRSPACSMAWPATTTAPTRSCRWATRSSGAAATVRAVDLEVRRAHSGCRGRHRHLVGRSRAHRRDRRRARLLGRDDRGGSPPSAEDRVRRRRRREAALRRRRVRRRDDQLRPAQRRAPEDRAGGDVPRAQARWAPGRLRVLQASACPVPHGVRRLHEVRDAGGRGCRQLEQGRVRLPAGVDRGMARPGHAHPVDPRRRIHAGGLPQPDGRSRGAAPRPQARGRRDPGLDRPAPAETNS